MRGQAASGGTIDTIGASARFVGVGTQPVARFAAAFTRRQTAEDPQSV